MTHSLSPVLRVGNWVLPLVVAAFVAALIAYAISGAIASHAVSAKPSPAVVSNSCPPIGDGYGSYLDSSIVAESRRIACGHVAQ